MSNLGLEVEVVERMMKEMEEEEEEKAGDCLAFCKNFAK